MAITILIIDRDVNLRTGMRDIHHLDGYEVIEADNGYDGIAMAKAHKPSLIYCRNWIAKIPGVEVCKRLKQDPETASIPFILMSVRCADVRSKNEDKDCFDLCVAVPFEAEELLEWTAKFTGRKDS